MGRQSVEVRAERPAAFTDDHRLHRRRVARSRIRHRDRCERPRLGHSTSGQTISLFDNSGKPLSPPEGYNFGGKLRTMQGIIVTPNGDVWALDFGDDKVVYMPRAIRRRRSSTASQPTASPTRTVPAS